MSGQTKPRAWVTWALLGAVAVLAVLPLLTGAADHLEEPFVGADGEAEGLVAELNPDYEPWLSPLVELPSGEVESGLFALQAAIGAGVVGYVLGVVRTRSRFRHDAAVGGAGTATAPVTVPAAVAEPEAGTRPERVAEPRPGPAGPPPNDDTAER